MYNILLEFVMCWMNINPYEYLNDSFVQSAAVNRQKLVEASSPPRFAGLPAGSTQVGGRTVNLSTVKRKRPVPLSEVKLLI